MLQVEDRTASEGWPPVSPMRMSTEMEVPEMEMERLPLPEMCGQFFSR
jgi:hypothetical protein